MNPSLPLRSTEELYRIYESETYTYPYTFEINNKKQRLFYIGAKHINNETNSQNDYIKTRFSEFVDMQQKDNTIVIVEGGVDKANFENEIDAIHNGGEGGLLTYLAKHIGVKVISGEPSEKYEIEKLGNYFSAEDIIEYYFAREAEYWNRLPENAKKPFREHIEERAGKFKNYSLFENFDFSIENLVKIHLKKYPGIFNEKDRKSFYEEARPKKGNVSEASGIIRDEYMVSRILELWNKGYSIFVVYGSSHAIVQEPALRTMLK